MGARAENTRGERENDAEAEDGKTLKHEAENEACAPVGCQTNKMYVGIGPAGGVPAAGLEPARSFHPNGF